VAVADADQLPLFEDQKVQGSQVRIIKAGDGLSDALDAGLTTDSANTGMRVSFVSYLARHSARSLP